MKYVCTKSSPCSLPITAQGNAKLKAVQREQIKKDSTILAYIIDQARLAKLL